MMLTFDRPIPFTTFGKRNVTNVPAQSLFIMNDPFVSQQAEVLARKVATLSGLSDEERIQWIYQRAFTRKANANEVGQALSFLKQQAEVHKVKPKDVSTPVLVWKDYCHTIFNMKEFVYLI